jgi:hypothetical protein
MPEIEVIGSIDDRGQLLLPQPLNLSQHTRVLVRITLLDQEAESDFEPDTDSKAQLLTDLKKSLRQAEAGQTHPISELWDGIDV